MKSTIINQANKLFGAGKEEEAIKLLIPLANDGNILAKSSLGLMYCYYYKKGEFIHFKKGQKLLEESCEAGEQSACHNLGTLWLGATPNIGHDLKKAAYYYLKAKELGDPIADPPFYEQWQKIINGQNGF